MQGGEWLNLIEKYGVIEILGIDELEEMEERAMIILHQKLWSEKHSKWEQPEDMGWLTDCNIEMAV